MPTEHGNELVEKYAQWGEEAIRHFMVTQEVGNSYDREIYEDDITDLLADIMHYYYKHGDINGDWISFDDCLDRARMHFEAETADDYDGEA